jgi:cytochrome bd-type quinol oxidase subunit 2
MEKFFLVLHAISLFFLLITLGLAYKEGYEWLRGTQEKLNEKRVTKLHHRAWLGIVLMLMTGFAAFWGHHAEFLAKWQFHAKMGFIMLVIVNCLVITFIKKNASLHSFKNLPTSKKVPIILSATIATIGWVGILFMALFIGIDEK